MGITIKGMGGLIVIAFMGYKIKQANKDIDRLFKIREQLEAEKATAQTQLKNHQIRQQNEQNHHTTDRNELIEGLHAQGDLRD